TIPVRQSTLDPGDDRGPASKRLVGRHSSVSFALHVAPLNDLAFIHRQLDAERRAGIQTVAVNGNGPVMEFDQITHNREAQTEPATRTTDNTALLREWFKHVWKHFWRDPHAVVLNGQAEVAIVPNGSYRNLRPGFAVLRRVGHEICDDLRHSRRIDVRGQPGSWHQHGQAEPTFTEQWIH